MGSQGVGLLMPPLPSELPFSHYFPSLPFLCLVYCEALSLNSHYACCVRSLRREINSLCPVIQVKTECSANGFQTSQLVGIRHK